MSLSEGRTSSPPAHRHTSMSLHSPADPRVTKQKARPTCLPVRSGLVCGTQLQHLCDTVCDVWAALHLISRPWLPVI